jgi:hypothetical protein
VIWRSSRRWAAVGHFGHRLLFGSRRQVWISSGERQEFTPRRTWRSTSARSFGSTTTAACPPTILRRRVAA